MRYLLLSILLLFIGQTTASAQTNLVVWVENKDTSSLRTFVLKSDIYFANDWILKNADMEEISDFTNGYVLTWTKTTNNIRYQRAYTFDLNARFVRCHEQRFVNDTLLTQGYVEFKDKAIQYISQAIPNKESLKKMNGYWNYEVDGFYYEIYNGGKLSCIYKAVNSNHYYMLFEKWRKDKIELIRGNDCLGIMK